MGDKDATSAKATEVYDGVSVITIDLDYDFEWYTTHSDFVDKRIGIIPNVIGVKIRHSATGRTHLMLVLSDPVSLFENFLIRAFVGDDPYRLACDMSRYFTFRTPESYGRLFDEKVSAKGKRSAGDWLDWAVAGTRRGIEKIDRGLRE